MKLLLYFFTLCVCIDYTQQTIQMKLLKLTHYHMQTCILMELEQEGVVDI